MASSPVASETGTMGSFTVIGSDLDTGIDYMLLEGTDQAMDPVEPAQDMELDPARNKDTLAAQLHEMEKVMASLGLDPKPDEGVAASCAKPETGSVPAGFVAAAAPAQSPQHPDPSELMVALVFDSQKETFTLEGWETLVPAMPATASKFFRGITHGELSALLEAFKNSTWTAALIAKIAEVYYISKREAEHTEILKVKHTAARGGSMSDLKEKDPGTPAQLVCSDCNAPWGKGAKCLLCQGTSPVDLSAHPLSVIEVDGLSWQLRLTDAGPTWVPADTKATKAAGFVEVGDMGRPPPSAASGASKGLVSFSEQVPAEQRLTLQEQVTQFGQDEIFRPADQKPPSMEEKDETQTALIFHPRTIQMVRFKAELLATPEEALDVEAADSKKRRKEAKQKKEVEDMEGELATLVTMQQGAHSVPQPLGASTFRNLDLQQFRSYLKRKHEESGDVVSYDAIMAAQTSQKAATAANQALDAELRGRRMALKPVEVESFSLWTPELQSAWQNNLFAPRNDPQGPETFNMDALKQPYLRMKELIKENRPSLFQDRLMTQFPTIKLDLLTYQDDTDTSLDAKLARELPKDSLERKYAVLDSLLQYHKGEVRMWGGEWEIRQGPLQAPSWAKSAPTNEVLALETRTNPLGISLYTPQTYSEQEVLKQIEEGKRPALDKIVGFFWAPGSAVASRTDDTHAVRRVQSWDLPSLITMLGQSWTFKEIYQLWCAMPLVVQSVRRGKGPGIKQKKVEELTAHRRQTGEIKSFLASVGLRFPQSQQEIKLLYKEIGSFLAASVFLARTPAVVLDVPEQAIQDTKEQLRFRAVCDERITLPLEAFKPLPDIFQALTNTLGAHSVVQAQVAWRCNCELWWVALVPPEQAEVFYQRLGYPATEIDSFLRLGLEPEALKATTVASRTDKFPELSLDNVKSICSPKYKKEHFGHRGVHAFWGRADCGLILSSISPWELKTKEAGVSRGGWVCKACQGFWRQGKGASRFVQLIGEHKGVKSNLQLILDEPPQQLYNEWVKSRLEFYKRVEPTAPPRDVALEVDPDHTQRLKFSCQNGNGNISNAIWSVLLSNPDLEGLKKISELAARKVQPV